MLCLSPLCAEPGFRAERSACVCTRSISWSLWLIPDNSVANGPKIFAGIETVYTISNGTILEHEGKDIGGSLFNGSGFRSMEAGVFQLATAVEQSDPFRERQLWDHQKSAFAHYPWNGQYRKKVFCHPRMRLTFRAHSTER